MSFGRSLIEYVQCDDCGAQIPKTEAIEKDGGFSYYYFCSQSCLEAENEDRYKNGLPLLE